MTELNGFLPKGMHTLVHLLGDVAKGSVTLMLMLRMRWALLSKFITA